MHTSAKEYLKEKGLKATAPRVAVVDVLLASRTPLSVADVLKSMPKNRADQATVYRILEAFAEAGLARRVELGKGHACYELARDGEHHHHLVCTACGRIEDVEDCEIETFATAALKASKSFARVDRHSLELFGLCRDCAKKDEPRRVRGPV